MTPTSPAVPRRRRARLIALAAALVGLVGGLMVATTMTANAADTLLSQGKPVTASSAENAGTAAGNAVDGNTNTRWSSAFSNPQWIQVDLGATYTISQVVLQWEAAYGTAFWNVSGHYGGFAHHSPHRQRCGGVHRQSSPLQLATDCGVRNRHIRHSDPSSFAQRQ